MGEYLKLKGESNEAWLEREAIEVPREEAEEAFLANIKVVACIQNEMFSAALMMKGDGDYNAVFKNQNDLRPIRFFLVDDFKLTVDLVR